MLENLFSETGYSASICIDIETKNNFKPLIFNIYSKPDFVNRFLPLFYGVDSGICDSFHRIIPGSRCIMAVFDYFQGVPLKDQLKTIPAADYPARAQIIGQLLDAVLVLDMLPPVFAISALGEPNTVYIKKDNTVRLNFLIKPVPDPAVDETKDAFTGYMEQAIVKNRYLPDLAVDFLKKVQSGELTGFVQINAAWRGIATAAMDEHEKYKKESFIKYLKRRSKQKAKEKLAKRKEKKKNV